MGGGPQRDERQDVLVFMAFVIFVVLVCVTVLVAGETGHSDRWVAIGAVGSWLQAVGVVASVWYLGRQVNDARNEASRQCLLTDLAVLERVLADQLGPAIRNLEVGHAEIMGPLYAAESGGAENTTEWYLSHPRRILPLLDEAKVVAMEASHAAELVAYADSSLLDVVRTIVDSIQNAEEVCREALGLPPFYDLDDPPPWARVHFDWPVNRHLAGISRVRPLIVEMTGTLHEVRGRSRTLRLSASRVSR